MAYIEKTIYERVVTRVAHRQPVRAEPDNVDISVPKTVEHTIILHYFYYYSNKYLFIIFETKYMF